MGLRQGLHNHAELGEAQAGRQVDLAPQQRRELLENGDPDRVLDEPLQDRVGDQICYPADLEKDSGDSTSSINVRSLSSASAWR